MKWRPDRGRTVSRACFALMSADGGVPQGVWRVSERKWRHLRPGLAIWFSRGASCALDAYGRSAAAGLRTGIDIARPTSDTFHMVRCVLSGWVAACLQGVGCLTTVAYDRSVRGSGAIDVLCMLIAPQSDRRGGMRTMIKGRALCLSRSSLASHHPCVQTSHLFSSPLWPSSSCDPPNACCFPRDSLWAWIRPRPARTRASTAAWFSTPPWGVLDTCRPSIPMKVVWPARFGRVPLRPCFMDLSPPWRRPKGLRYCTRAAL